LLQIGLTGFFLLIIILAWSQTVAQQKENRKFIILWTADRTDQSGSNHLGKPVPGT